MIDSQSRCWKTKHHEWIFTCSKCPCCEVYSIAKLLHEDPLVTTYQFSSFINVGTKFIPEWRVENVMQSKRNERTFDRSEDKRCKRFVRINHTL
ncbi:hypothetical protein D3C75_604700 [compost metagenome]